MDGAQHTPNLPPTSQDVPPGLLQHHQQAVEQDVTQNAEQSNELYKAAHQEAEDLRNKLSSLGLRPQPPTPGCRLYRSTPEHPMLAALAKGLCMVAPALPC